MTTDALIIKRFTELEVQMNALPLDRARDILNRNTVFQSLTALTREEFLTIITEGSTESNE